jgi:hypothetical protein
MEPSDDISCSLGEIRSSLQGPIKSSLLEIQKHQFPKVKSIDWISNLECLSIPPKVGIKRRYGDEGEPVELDPQPRVLRRCKINPLENFKERNYIAISWVWTPEPDEERTIGGYLIESRNGQELPSDVRDTVLKRVINYASCSGDEHFWIDKICINQDDKEKLEVATQAMDMVYTLSRKSVAIINMHIETKMELYILEDLMTGRLPRANGVLSTYNSPGAGIVYKPSEALKLLDRLTSTSWWMRAWTFQEDYKASVKMVLLIPHDPSLEGWKTVSVCGEVHGELCINSAKFRSRVTKFCQAYQHQWGFNQEDMETCNRILERAAKYTVLLQERGEDGDNVFRRPMAPTILADIGARQITKPWDRLAIMANCCNYDIRLNANKLREGKFSHSLALLTQHLLNGEIVKNEQSDNQGSTQNIFDFLKSQSLDSFRSPIKKELTFIKSCRFTKVELVNEGLQTSGHLWKLGERIEVKCEIKLPGEDSTLGGFSGYQRYRLKQFAQELANGLYGRSYEAVGEDFLSYLKQEKTSQDTFVEQYMFWMANEICRAMEDPRKVLRLGCLANGSNN